MTSSAAVDDQATPSSIRSHSAGKEGRRKVKGSSAEEEPKVP